MRLDVAILIVVCALALGHAAHFGHTADDSYIAFRYVDNWSEGNGIVFNVGERVMGYSSFLWVVLLYLLEQVRIDAPTGGRILGTLFAWGTLVRLYLHARRVHPGRAPAIAAVAPLVASGGFCLWMFGGLEAHLLGFLLLAGTLLALETGSDAPLARFLWLGVVLGLAAWTRPEAIVYVAPIGLWLWLQRRDRSRAGAVAIALLVAAAFYGGLALWAWSYYGDPLPNTYYAKAHPLSGDLLARGWFLMRKFFVDYRGAPLLAVVAWAAATRGSASARGWLPLAIIATFSVFFLRIGGDALVYHRMWLPMLPLFGLLVAEAVARFRARTVALALPAVLVALTLPDSLVGPNLEVLRTDNEILAGIRRIGARLRQLPPTTLVAANNVGILAYESRLPIVDMLGLNDAHIARAPGKRIGIPGHESHDGSYVLDRVPDLVFTGMPRVVTVKNPEEDVYGGWYPSDRDLFADDRFLRHYELRYLDLPDGGFSPVFALGTGSAAR